MAPHNKLAELAQQLNGELFTDYSTRLLYATDASVYREIPMAVARPKNKEDIRTLIQFAHKTAKIAYELRKLRVRGAIKKLKNTHYYQLTEEGYKWMYYMIFNYSYFISPLLSKGFKKSIKQNVENPSKIEEAYSQINKALTLITSELKIVA